MLHAAEIKDDGWTRRHVGPKGVLLRRNPEHIQRVLRAIEQRVERDVSYKIDPLTMKELMQ